MGPTLVFMLLKKKYLDIATVESRMIGMSSDSWS